MEIFLIDTLRCDLSFSAFHYDVIHFTFLFSNLFSLALFLLFCTNLMRYSFIAQHDYAYHQLRLDSQSSRFPWNLNKRGRKGGGDNTKKRKPKWTIHVCKYKRKRFRIIFFIFFRFVFVCVLCGRTPKPNWCIYLTQFNMEWFTLSSESGIIAAHLWFSIPFLSLYLSPPLLLFFSFYSESQFHLA